MRLNLVIAKANQIKPLLAYFLISYPCPFKLCFSENVTIHPCSGVKIYVF
jgi:hypothetical protein